MREINPLLRPYLEKMIKRALEAKARADGAPFFVAYLLTNRCMCDCKSCLWKRNEWEDLPTDAIKKFYREAKALGFVGTACSGGEPFLRQDLGELMRFIKEEAEMPIMLFTTGWFLEERMDEVLPHLTMLMLSLDAASAEKHDEIRGRPGLFNRIVKGVELVKRKYPRLPVQFNTCVQKGIAEEIDDLIGMARDLDVKISFDVISEYRHGADGSHYTETTMGLSLPELRGVAEYLLEKKQAGAPIINSELYFKYFAAGKPGYKCHNPKVCLWVDGRGNVENCLDLEHNIANIREMPLKDILALPRYKQMQKDAEACCSCSSPTMVDVSQIWEDPALLFRPDGVSVG